MVILFLLFNNLNYTKPSIYFFRRFEGNSFSTCVIGLFILGFVITVTNFNAFSSKRSSIFYLSLPATTFEKIFAHWIITVPVFLFFYQLLWLITSIIINYFTERITGLNLGLFVPVWKNAFGNSYTEVFALYIAIQSFFFAGTVLTGKSSFIKTTITALIIVIIIIVSTNFIDNEFFANINRFSFNLRFKLDSPSLHSTMLNSIIMPISLLLIPVCYLVAYYFLKEKEV
jgi:hypothetical protein